MKSIVVVGAGCFGAWTALHLARAGRRVTLIDAQAPGHARSSSGGETRIVRAGYGAQEMYTRWATRSLEEWKALSSRAAPPLFHETGVLWMARKEDALTTSTVATLQHVGVPHERLSRAELDARWPQIDFGPVTWAIHEPNAGVVAARRAVAQVAREAEGAGARALRAAVVPPVLGGARLGAIRTAAGEEIRADTFVFACGPWLPKLFPELLGERIFPTRQEVFYFGTPSGDARFSTPMCPAWIDFGEEIYGVPDLEGRGFKIGLDRHGPPFDPDTGDRVAVTTLDEVRSHLGRRFPALAAAPHLATEVCQYENTSSGDFLLDRHPEFKDVWLVGGGSGHGFKHGPAVGELAAKLVVEGGLADERLRLETKRSARARSVF